LSADELCNYASLTQKVPLEEVRYFLLLSKDLGYMNKNIFESLESNSETLSKGRKAKESGDSYQL